MKDNILLPEFIGGEFITRLTIWDTQHVDLFFFIYYYESLPPTVPELYSSIITYLYNSLCSN